MSAPRLLLCAPASGGGKTTVTCALLQALVNRGAGPVAFKCGPDYIDPMFHSEIIGAKSRNLDLFFLGRDTARYLLEKNSRGSGLALIEGVMGYYDGIGLSADASAYDLARATGTPAVLVLDGRGRALTAAAAVKGMRDFRPDSGIRGVVLNRVSPMLYPRLKEAIEGETGVTVYGYLPNLPGCALESRHLGLVTAAEVAGLRERGHRRPAGPGGLRPGAKRPGPRPAAPGGGAAPHRRGPGQGVLLLLRRRPGAAGGAGGRADGVLPPGG